MAATERTDAEFFLRRVSEMEDRELPRTPQFDPYIFAMKDPRANNARTGAHRRRQGQGQGQAWKK